MRVLCTLAVYLGLAGWLLVPWAIVEALAARRERILLRACVVELLARVRALPPVPREVGEEGEDRGPE